MIAYGKRKLHANYPDCHPKKGYVNWWEFEINMVNKKKERQLNKKELREFK